VRGSDRCDGIRSSTPFGIVYKRLGGVAWESLRSPPAAPPLLSVVKPSGTQLCFRAPLFCQLTQFSGKGSVPLMFEVVFSYFV
jgi:hypothetical protein